MSSWSRAPASPSRPRRRGPDRGRRRDRATARPPARRGHRPHRRRRRLSGGPCAGAVGRGDLLRSRRAARRLALASLFEAEFGQRTAAAVLERHLAETEGDPETARYARLLVAPWSEPRPDRRPHRGGGAPVPGHDAGPDGPRPAPCGHLRGATLARDAGPGGDRRVGRAREGLRRGPGPAPRQRGPRTRRPGGRGRRTRGPTRNPDPDAPEGPQEGAGQWRPRTSG